MEVTNRSYDYGARRTWHPAESYSAEIISTSIPFHSHSPCASRVCNLQSTHHVNEKCLLQPLVFQVRLAQTKAAAKQFAEYFRVPWPHPLPQDDALGQPFRVWYVVRLWSSSLPRIGLCSEGYGLQ